MEGHMLTMPIAFGFLGVGAPEDPYLTEIVSRLKQERIALFERLGVEYTKGFLAARLRRKPYRLGHFLLKYGYLGVAAEAAAKMLETHGIDPYSCGRELYD